MITDSVTLLNTTEAIGKLSDIIPHGVNINQVFAFEAH
jgi:hypothetical protein